MGYAIILVTENLSSIGPNSNITSVHLPKPYLHVAVPENKVYFPKNIATHVTILGNVKQFINLQDIQKKTRIWVSFCFLGC